MAEETTPTESGDQSNLVQDPLKAEFEAEAGNNLETNVARLRKEATETDLRKPSYVEGSDSSLDDLDKTVQAIESQSAEADAVENRAGEVYERLKATKR